MIYFNDKKEAFGFEIKNPIAIIEESLWAEFCDDPSSFDIVGGEFKSLKDTEEYKKRILKSKNEARMAKIKEELYELDLKSIRPARAGESEKLKELENAAIILREELASLTESEE